MTYFVLGCLSFLVFGTIITLGIFKEDIMITTSFKVQTVDCKAPNFAEKFHQSLKETGFASLVNHGIDLSLVQERMRENGLA